VYCQSTELEFSKDYLALFMISSTYISGLSMKLISINVSMPRNVLYKDRTYKTGIFKDPVDGPVLLGKLNLEGDGQADLKNHGGFDQAVYFYSLEHYKFWRKKLNKDSLPPGLFGENFTVTGMTEENVFIGDIYRIGEAKIQVTKPRSPCFKLNMRMETDDFVEVFIKEEKPGFYCRVVEEGFVEAGNEIILIEQGNIEKSIKHVFHFKHATKNEL